MPTMMPRQAVPELSFPLVSGETFDLAVESIDNYLMVIVYRGLHCPVCKSYLRGLERQLADWTALGVSVVTVSADPQDRAQKSKEDWSLESLRIGYGLTEEQMRTWGLYVSNAIK
ncbi:MAG: redoxin domain-containing protein, partial [Acidobacteriota bacterium]